MNTSLSHRLLRPSSGVCKKTRAYIPVCPWRLTSLNADVRVVRAKTLEDAALIISLGIPIAAEFDDSSSNSFYPVHYSSLAKLHRNPVLARKHEALNA